MRHTIKRTAVTIVSIKLKHLVNFNSIKPSNSLIDIYAISSHNKVYLSMFKSRDGDEHFYKTSLSKPTSISATMSPPTATTPEAPSISTSPSTGIRISPALNPILMLTPKALARKRQKILQAMKSTPDEVQYQEDSDDDGIRTWITDPTDIISLPKSSTIDEGSIIKEEKTNSSENLNTPNSFLTKTLSTSTHDSLDTPPPLHTNLLNPSYISDDDDELDPPPELNSLIDAGDNNNDKEISTSISPNPDPDQSLLSTPSFSFENARRKRREFIRSIEVISEHRRDLKRSRKEETPITPTVMNGNGYGNSSGINSDSIFNTPHSPYKHLPSYNTTLSSSPFISDPSKLHTELLPPTQPQFTGVKKGWTSDDWERLTVYVEDLELDKAEDLTALPMLPTYVLNEFSDFTSLEVQRRALAIARQIRKTQLARDRTEF